MINRIGYVVDHLQSGLGIAARARASLDPRIQVISATTFPTPGSLIKFLNYRDFSLLVFSWRFLLCELFAFTNFQDLINSRIDETRLAIIIPDHLGSNPKFHSVESRLIGCVDYFFVTNELLKNQYESSENAHTFAGIFHDIPLLSEISEVKKLRIQKNERQVIWVGNSNWGSNQGYEDHKGYFNWIEPLKRVLQAEHGVTLVTIDSAQVSRAHSVVLEEIAKSTVLVQASEAEGTGLPVLEALALGTTPISFPVGIFPEIFHPGEENVVTTKSVEALVTAVNCGLKQHNSLRNEQRFLSYLDKAKDEELIQYEFPRRKMVQIEAALWTRLLFLLKWILRYLKFTLIR